MNKYTTMRECLMRDIHDLEDQRDFAMSEMGRRGCERDKARDMVLRLRKQRAIARKFGEQMERERNEAREAFAIATNNCVDAQQDLRRAREREEKLLQAVAALKSQISNLKSP